MDPELEKNAIPKLPYMGFGCLVIMLAIVALGWLAWQLVFNQPS